ncbi:NUDIX hydrolase [Candidatus Fermentibacteria bacterium]|nr:NUDIX hydrolase [Candidatus Fermentibacteria bacterium]
MRGKRIVLIERGHFPAGWAIPGGFVDPGESLAEAVRREALEETGLEIEIKDLFHVYSRPWRDPRGDTVSVMYHCTAEGAPRGGDDAETARAFRFSEIPWDEMAFDHAEVLRDFLRFLETGEKPSLEK